MSPFSFSSVFSFRRCFCLTLFWLVVKKSKAFPLPSLFLLIMFGKCHVPFFLFSRPTYLLSVSWLGRLPTKIVNAMSRLVGQDMSVLIISLPPYSLFPYLSSFLLYVSHD
ncbi:hypothetical protein DM02DRAFT_35116 [Periconia macrospinosa]|uniref:Uncharacterized protein n=1 Tax=Periconia macrospinosa TaxID=97972 RepID=A0A2V1E6E0_9PLEO|nr:hypothetical protein DM02DRAFT_35116 [Periconia macrospinosa]